MSFLLGIKAVKKLVELGDSFGFHQAKLSPKLFKGDTEKGVYDFVSQHITKYHALPKPETLLAKFPEVKEVDCPEPPKYYLDKIGQRFAYDTINKANIGSQEALKSNQDDVQAAELILTNALREITEQRYRHRILNFGKEAKQLVLSHYFNMAASKNPPAFFGWPYMDASSGGILPGDVVSIVGRPSLGKSWCSLHIALYNWLANLNVLFVSMEMNTLAIAQRASSMFAHTNLTQLKLGAYSSSTFELFNKAMTKATLEVAKLHIVDGNLAASVEDIYTLAAQLGSNVVLIDGAYLLRNRNSRLGRYEKVAENTELIKRFTSDLEIGTVASWQFNREAAKKDMKKEKKGMEDIGSSDVIPQISSIVLALSQDDGVETMQSRVIEVMKGRSGETGEFKIRWDFQSMDFGQCDPPVGKEVDDEALLASV